MNFLKQIGNNMEKQKLKRKPAGLRGKALAKHIFETWENMGRVVGVHYLSCRGWKNNNVPAKHRAKIVEEAAKRGFDITEQQLRGDL